MTGAPPGPAGFLRIFLRRGLRRHSRDSNEVIADLFRVGVALLTAGLVLLTATVAISGVNAQEPPDRGAASDPVGAITGRAHASGATPDAPRMPLTGTAVMLVPYSDTFLADVEAIRREARDSLARYRASITDIRRIRHAYETRLRATGAPDLVRVATVDADGRFAIRGVPAGPWLLLAEHSAVVKTKQRPAKPPSGKTTDQVFLPRPQLLGYHNVTVWLETLTIEDGRTENIDLTDRNGWFSGIEERRAPAPAR